MSPFLSISAHMVVADLTEIVFEKLAFLILFYTFFKNI